MYTYCQNNPTDLSDESGFRSLYCVNPNEETEQQRMASFTTMNKAVSQLVYSQMKSLGYKKWSYRRDPADDSTREKEHVHLKGEGRDYQQDVDGNRRTKENSTGDPPRRAKEALKEKEGWDWDVNARKATAKKVATGGVVVGGGYVVYRVVRMIPSLFSQFWWTIPENLVTP